MAGIEEELLAAMGRSRGPGAADRLCEACVRLLDIDAAAVSLVFDGVNIGTLGASGATARVYDEVQFTHGEGPCLDAVAHRSPVSVIDLADPTHHHWPAYSPAMLDHDIHGVHAVPILVAGEYVGALDLFQSAPGRLAPEQLTGVAVAAELLQMPLLDLLHDTFLSAAERPGSPAWNELATLTRAEVSQATGMLMAQLGVTAPAALVRLRAHAYATNRSASEVARDIVTRRLRLDDD